MRSRVALLVLCAGLLAFMLLRGPVKDSATPPTTAAAGARAPRVAGPVVTAPPAVPARNVFEYAAPAAPPPPPTRSPVKPPPVLEEPAETTIVQAPEPVRLVGLVNRGGTLRAALSIFGEVVILGPGETAEGYRVLSIDDEAGVRLRGPDGAERALAPPDTR